MKKLYLDANVYLDWWFDRKDNMLPLGEFAHQLLMETFDCKFTIIYSDLVIEELSLVLKLKPLEIEERFFKKLRNYKKLELVSQDSENKRKAIELVNKKLLALKDAEHLTLSTKANAILVTRDAQILALEGYATLKPEGLL